MYNTYDIIGDIHGHAQKLKQLLEKLGYVEVDGVYRHPTRKVIFLGDFIDRGPEQVETLRIVKAMIDAGAALTVLGNHEFNAVAFATPDPDHPGEYLRKHTARNRHPHNEFLRQVGEGSPEYVEIIEWFKTLPVYLDLPGLRAIHACWHPEYITEIQQFLNPDQSIKAEAWVQSARKGSHAYELMETLLKGVETDLPEGISYLDKDGIERRRTRTRWWDKDARTYRELAVGSESMRSQLPDQDVPGMAVVNYESQHLVVFGHYWMQGTPQPLGPRVACLDYSIGKGSPSGKLCAYRWDGETDFCPDKFVWVTGGYEHDHTPDQPAL
jgi:hypothetical protein